MEQALLFSLGTVHCALEVAQIQEIVESPPFYYIPLAPTVIPGAINFHGNILPVIDLPAWLGMADSLRDRRVIVLAAALCSLALTVTAVRRIVPLDSDELMPAGEDGPLAEFTRAAFNCGDEVISLLDAPKLLSSLDKIGLGIGGEHGG